MAEDSKWSRYSRVHREISVVSDWLPDAPDTRSLGSITREWLNLFIGNAGAIYFGLAQDISLSRLAANILGLAAGDSFAVDTLLLDAANRDVNLYRSAANILKTDDRLDVGGSILVFGGSVHLYRSYRPWIDFIETTPDPDQIWRLMPDYERSSAMVIQNMTVSPSNVFFRIGSDGTLYIGESAYAALSDVNLYRSAANVLKTDDNFDALALRIGGTEVITSARNVTNVGTWEGMYPEAHASRHVDAGADEITSKLDFRAMNILQARATATATFTTTSTSAVDVTGLSVSITLPAAANVLVSCSCYAWSQTGGNAIYQQLLRGATAIKRTTQGATISVSANSLIECLDVNVAAGTYTYKLQGAVDGGTGNWYMAAAPSQGEITVIAWVY